MNKKLIALAVASVCSVPAFAQTSSVTLGGRAAIGVDNYSASGATDANSNMKGRTRVLDTTSRIILRGREDLGNGLRAVFDIETGIRMDTGSNLANNGNADAASGFFGTRHAWAGLEGAFGRVTLGRQNVFWNSSLDTHTAVYHVPTPGYFSGSNFGRVVGPTARTNNTIQYQSPAFAGIATRLSYSTNGDTVQANGNTNAYIYGATLEGNHGPVSWQIDYARNQFATPFPANADRPNNTGLKGLVGFTYMPGARIVGYAGDYRNNNVAAAVANFAAAGDDLRQRSFGVAWEHLFGNVRLLASYHQAQKVKGCSASNGVGPGAANGCDNTGSRGWTVGANYLFSKRTHATLYYTQIRNQANQTSDYVAGGWTASTGLARGADPRMFGVGLVHNF